MSLSDDTDEVARCLDFKWFRDTLYVNQLNCYQNCYPVGIISVQRQLAWMRFASTGPPPFQIRTSTVVCSENPTNRSPWQAEVGTMNLMSSMFWIYSPCTRVKRDVRTVACSICTRITLIQPHDKFVQLYDKTFPNCRCARTGKWEYWQGSSSTIICSVKADIFKRLC